jgi:rhodanese-related sulfurtransferase
VAFRQAGYEAIHTGHVIELVLYLKTIKIGRQNMYQLIQNRSNFFALLISGLALIWLVSTNSSHSSIARYDVPEVDNVQAKALVDAGALVVDVRGAEQFAYRHIPGAVLIPLEVLRTAIPASIAAAKQKSVVVYCGDGISHGPEATHLLQQAGFKKAVNLKSGIEGWSNAGLPIRKGS